MKLAVLGPGGVGGFLAAALARDGHQVVVVAREETAEKIASKGIEVRSLRLGSFSAHPNATPALSATVDVLIVATKATGLQDALARIAVPPHLVIPLLNGLEHLAVLRDRFDEGCVAAGAIRIESTRVRTGLVEQTSPFLRIDLATEQPALLPALQRAADVLRQAGVPVRVLDSEAQVMWEKLVRLSALSCSTSAFDLPLGEIRDDPELRVILERCVREAAAVARAEGAAIEPEDTLGELAEAHFELRSSMQRDIAAGRPPELDAIAGAVLRAGARHGLGCPTIAELAARVAQRAGIAPPAG